MYSNPMFPVPAREMHQRAGITTPFSQWIKARIRSLNLSVGKDYIRGTYTPPDTRRKIDNYFLTMVAATDIVSSIDSDEKRFNLYPFLNNLFTPEVQEWFEIFLVAQGRGDLIPEEVRNSYRSDLE